MGQKSIINAPETPAEAAALAKRIAGGKMQKGDATRAARIFGIETRGTRRAVFMALTRALGETKNETASLGLSVVRKVAPKASVHLSSHPNGLAMAYVSVDKPYASTLKMIKGKTTGAAIIAALVLHMTEPKGVPHAGR